MNKAIVAICVVLLVFNSIFIVFSPDEDLGGWISGDDDDDDTKISDELNVTVPATYHGDIANYNNQIFGEMYWINYTTNNWTKITLDMTGSEVLNILNAGSHEDGFGEMHQVIPKSTYFDATVTLRYQDHEGEDITINGGAIISRVDYRDLNERNTIKSTTDGKVEIDQTLQALFPLKFSGNLRSYPDPNEEVEETLDELIFGQQKSISINKTGEITKNLYDTGNEASFYNTVYKWVADKKEIISGYETIRINIDATFGQTEWKLPFLRQVWISNEVSQPVKIYTRTNQSAMDENGEFYFILENTKTIREKGFSRGDKSISWDGCNADVHFEDKNPTGEYLDWTYMPQGGSSIDESSFDFNPDEAVSIALKDSPNLQEFIADRDNDVIISYAQYNSTKDPTEVTQTGSHRWLLLFTHELDPEELEYRWENDIPIKERYALQVTYNTTKLGLSDTKEIENDWGLLNWSGEMSKDDLEDQMLTVAAAEEILKSDSEVNSRLYTNPLDPDKIYWNDPLGSVQMYLGQGITQEQTPSIGVIETLTGFTIPTAKISWIVQKGQLYDASGDSGSTFGAAVDAETGQLQYVLEVEGTSLFSVFG